MSIQTYTDETFNTTDLETVHELPPFAHFLGSPIMRERHVAGPPGAPGQVMVWTCDKDGFTYDPIPAPEAAFIFQGVARFTDTTGTETVVRAGQGYRLPAGWSGTFEALEPVRKVFVLL